MNLSELRSDINFICGSTSASYPDADKTRNMNNAYHDVSRIIWEAQSGWQYDDTNSTTLPIATTSLVHGQQDYELPSTAQRIERVQIKDSEGHWHKLRQIDIHDINIATEEFFGGDAGQPLYYDLIGRSVMLYPTPASGAVTLTNGLQLFVNRDVTEFVVTATTTIPGFATPFHKILSLAASIDFIQDERQKKTLAEQKLRLEQGLTRFYGRRHDERQARIIPSAKKNWRTYT